MPSNSGPWATAVALRMNSLSGRQSLALTLTRNLTLPRELESKIKSKSKSKRQASVLNSTAVGPWAPAHRRLTTPVSAKSANNGNPIAISRFSSRPRAATAGGGRPRHRPHVAYPPPALLLSDSSRQRDQKAGSHPHLEAFHSCNDRHCPSGESSFHWLRGASSLLNELRIDLLHFGRRGFISGLVNLLQRLEHFLHLIGRHLMSVVH